MSCFVLLRTKHDINGNSRFAVLHLPSGEVERGDARGLGACVDDLAKRLGVPSPPAGSGSMREFMLTPAEFRRQTKGAP